jgi:hypothetical protein
LVLVAILISIKSIIFAATKSKQIQVFIMVIARDGASTDANMDTVLVERAFILLILHILLIHLIENYDGKP